MPCFKKVLRQMTKQNHSQKSQPFYLWFLTLEELQKIPMKSLAFTVDFTIGLKWKQMSNHCESRQWLIDNTTTRNRVPSLIYIEITIILTASFKYLKKAKLSSFHLRKLQINNLMVAIITLPRLDQQEKLKIVICSKFTMGHLSLCKNMA